MNSKRLSAVLGSCVLLALLISPSRTRGAHPDSFPTRFSVAVVDDNQVALDGAEILVSVFQGGSRANIKEVSNAKEPLQVDLRSIGLVIIRVDKEGYYTHLEKVELQIDSEHSRYEPWGVEYQIRLKKKISPRPLYVHRVNWLPVPALDKPCGFDLEAGDWVAPQGKGVTSDFIFTLSRTLGQGELYEGRMVLTFSNEQDGVITVNSSAGAGSRLLLGQEAPLDGYEQPVVSTEGVYMFDDGLRRSDSPSKAELDRVEGAWFRVRSEVDEATGSLKCARYGKIDGFVNFEVREREIGGQVRFVYYLSPDDSRSLEFNGESLVENADLQGVTKY